MSLARVSTLLAILAIAPVAAHAQTTITACYVPKTGSVYRIKAAGAPDACKTSHVEFSWQSGGITFTRRFTPSVVIAPNNFGSAFASCEAGETVTGGGYSTIPSLPVGAAANSPTDVVGLHANSWFVDVHNLSGEDVSMTAYVICAKPAS